MKMEMRGWVSTQGNQVPLETIRFRTVSPGIGAVLLSGSFLVAVVIFVLTGCGATPAQKANTNFFTSGSREADQRASQRMAQTEQLSGAGEGSGEKGVKKAQVVKSEAATAGTTAGTTNKPAQATEKLALFERLGGEAGVSNIVADFTPRVLDDPRVNWNREGIKRGGISIHREKSETWNPSLQNVALLKKHLAEFFALATGGPAHYTGGQLETVHADMHISNPEFDAAIGDLKASLDKLKIPNLEQKELLAIVESTRPEIVTKR
jgi:hemoglobin